VSDPEPERDPAPFSGRAAFAISQSYYYLAAVIGVGLLLGGVIETLIGLRELVLPSAEGGPFGGTVDTSSRDALRSVLGGLAFVIPGGFVCLWHIREARRREVRTVPGTFWGSALYFHLVALVSLSIAVGGTISLLNSLRDAAVPRCYSTPELIIPALDGSSVPGVGSGPITVSPASDLFPTRRECDPPRSDSLRSAVDALIVTGVAGATWVWHLRRGRRIDAAPPPGP